MDMASWGNVACDISSLRQRMCRRVAWLSMVLVLLNTLATFVLPLTPPSRLAPSEPTFGRVLICTAGGLVEWGGEVTPTTKGGVEHVDVCVSCLPLLGAVLFTPSYLVWAALQPAPPATTYGTESRRFYDIDHRPGARGPPHPSLP